MKWLKALFQNSDNNVQEGDTILVGGFYEIKKDIGEPVYSFVNCFTKNHRRFKIERLKIGGTYSYHRSSFQFIDKQTNEKWLVCIDHRTTRKLACNKLEWLTDDECIFIHTEILDFISNRVKRLHEIRNIRHQRKQKLERERLMEIYK